MVAPLQLVRDSAPAAREKSHHSSCPSDSFHGAHRVPLLPALPVGSPSVLLCRSNSPSTRYFSEIMPVVTGGQGWVGTGLRGLQCTVGRNWTREEAKGTEIRERMANHPSFHRAEAFPRMWNFRCWTPMVQDKLGWWATLEHQIAERVTTNRASVSQMPMLFPFRDQDSFS